MKKGWKIFSIFLVIISVSIGITAGILINNFKQIEFEINNITVDGIHQNEFSWDIDLRINVSIVSPAMSFSGEGGTFSVKAGGVFIGNGEIGRFQASSVSNDLMIYFNGTVGLALAVNLIEYLLGADLVIKITIENVKIIGMVIPLNYILIKTVNIDEF